MNIRKLGVATVLAALVAAISTGGTAAGVSTSDPPSSAVQQTVPMKVVAFDRAVAKAHGYDVRVDAHGHEYSSKAGTITPYNYVEGNCGDAYLWYYPQPGREADVSTGFEGLKLPAVSYSWDVAVTDSAGTGSKSWGGGLAFRESWHADWETYHSVTGYSWAEVTYGVAVLADGEVCSAEYPWDAGYLYN